MIRTSKLMGGALMVFTLVGMMIMTSCNDFPYGKPDWKKSTNTGGNSGNTGGSGNTEDFIVDYIPSQCDTTHSGVLGLKNSKGEYFMVLSNHKVFSQFSQGDKVEAEVKGTTEFAVCAACNCPAPDGGVLLESIKAK